MSIRTGHRSILDVRSEVVLEAELQLEVIDTETIRVVVAPGPLELAAHEDVLRRCDQQIQIARLSILERVRRLPRAVLDVDAGVADRGGEMLVPRVIQERDQRPDW